MGVALRWACLVFYEDKRFEHVFHPILQNSWWSDDLTFSWPCESRWSENTLNAVSLYTRVLLSLGRVFCHWALRIWILYGLLERSY